MKTQKIKIQRADVGAKIAPYVQAGQFLGTTISAAGGSGSGGDFAGSALSGAASGAAAGAALGPVGAVAGGAIGAIGGLVGAGKRKREKERAEQQLQQQMAFSGALSGTNSLLSEYYSNYEDPMGMEKGGTVGQYKRQNVPVYLNDGETVMHPDGSVKYIPKKGRKTDSVLSVEPVNSFVFGGVVDPELGKTYQDIAKDWFKPIRGDKTRYTDDTNLARKSIGNMLAKMQANTKEQKGVKPKTKSIKRGDLQKLNAVAAVSGDEQLSLADEEILNATIPEVVVEGNYPIDKQLEALKKRNDLYAEVATAYNANELNKSLKARSKRIFPNALSLAPIGYNFLRSLEDPEYQQPRFNLSVGDAIRQNRNRYDKIGANNAITNQQRIAMHNVNATGNVTGTNMSQRAAVARGTQNALADSYRNYAQLGQQIGQQNAQAILSAGQYNASALAAADNINAENRAAVGSFGQATVENLSNLGQTMDLMRNQYTRDLSILPYLRDYLQHGSTNTLNIV